MAAVEDLRIVSTRGGLNNSDHPTAIGDDQCVAATNIEWRSTTMGGRRNGTSPVTLHADLANKKYVWWMHRHTPTSDPADAELWVLGVDDDGGGGIPTYTLARKTDSWTTVPIGAGTIAWYGGPTYGNFPETRWDGVSHGGKLFIARRHVKGFESQDRLLVWDGQDVRNSGLKRPINPPLVNDKFDPAADQGGTGGLTGLRYYRVRHVVVNDEGDVILRSEPSDATAFTPSGAFTAIQITDNISGSDPDHHTHEEIEASIDGANFYRIGTVVTGATHDDTEVYSAGYTSYPLSEDVGAYSLFHNPRFLMVDEDRLMTLSHWYDSDRVCRMTWGPVYGAGGVGNNERWEAQQDSYMDLDTTGEAPTGWVRCYGYIYVFKRDRIYRIRRTYNRAKAYELDTVYDGVGAIEGSMVVAKNFAGRPTVYFLDPVLGPYEMLESGPQRATRDIDRTWSGVNIDANLPCVSYYYPDAKQVHWHVAHQVNLGDGTFVSTEYPYIDIVLHTEFNKFGRGGISIFNGKRARALCACLFADNIEDDDPRNKVLKPFIGTQEKNLSGGGLVQMTDDPNEVRDDTLAFPATLGTKSYSKGWAQKFGVLAGVLYARALTDGLMDVIVAGIGETADWSRTISLSPVGSESTYVVRDLDDLSGSNYRAVALTFMDGSSGTTVLYSPWKLLEFTLILTKEQRVAGR